MSALAGAARAQPEEPVVRPAAAGRFVHVFDFEESQTNPDEVPRYWFRSQDAPDGLRRAGFPNWNKAGLVYAESGVAPYAGTGCVRLPTRGGSTALVLSSGALPVFADADYRLSAMMRTEGLTHARGVLAARFLDRGGRPIPGGEFRSAPVLTGGEWRSVWLDLLGRFPDAAWLQIELQLLQPDVIAPPMPGDTSRVSHEDFAGAVLFDDVSVLQLPRMEIATASPCNIVLAPEKPEVKMLVRDLAGEALTLEARVYDLEGRVVDSMSRPVAGGTGTIAWSPTLSRLGWYRAGMELKSDGRPVGGTTIDFLWVRRDDTAAAARGPDAARFGLILDTLPAEQVRWLPELARRAGVGAMTIPIWDRALTPEQTAARARTLAPAIAGLIHDWREVTLGLPEAPVALADRVHKRPDDPWSVLQAEHAAWFPYATELFDVLGQRSARWQVGPTGDDRVFWSARAGEELAAVQAALSRLLPGPTVVVPTRLDRAWDPSILAAAPSALVASVPADLTPEAVGLCARAWRGSSGPALTGVFAPAEGASPAMACAHLARQAVEFWAGAGGPGGELPPGLSLALREPWTWDTSRRPQMSPAPALGVLRTLAHHLADRRVVGEFPAGEGVKCYILAPAARGKGSGALVAWRDGASLERAAITGFLGDGPFRVVDLFGNERPPEQVTSSKRPGVVRIPLTDAPVFIEGVDANLAKCLASIRVDPPTLESGGAAQERAVVIDNPWPVTLSGRIAVLEPGGFETGQKDRAWRIGPRAARFQVPPGGSERLAFSIAFGAGEEAGPKEFLFELELQGETRYGPLEVRRIVEVSLPRLHVDVTCTVRHGDDVVVEVSISNTGSEPRTLNLTAFAPGEPRRKGIIAELPAAQQASTYFVFAGAAGTMRGQRLVVSVEDADSSARTTKSVVVP